MQRIRRDFLPTDLEGEIQAAGIDGVVSVQARQSIEETRWLLSLADEYDFIKGVVGWMPLVDPRVGEYLEQFSANRKLKAVRHVVQGETDEQFILRSDFNVGVSALLDFDLVYDILIFERHLPQTIEFVDRHPEQVFVLDHIAKPRIKESVILPWAENIRELALRPNVYCKISGLVTEADYHAWTIKQLQPYWDVVLTAFGPQRLMFGSDWPVCLVACEYGRWVETVSELSAQLSTNEQNRLFGETASEVYHLNT